MARPFIGLLTLTLILASACAPAPTRGAVPVSNVRSLEGVRRLSIISFDAASFTLVEHRSQPGRTLDEVLSWHPYGAALRPLAALVHRGVNSALSRDHEIMVAGSVYDVAAGQVVAEAMAGRLRASRSLDEVRVLASEPIDTNRPEDALVRLTVTSWGLVRVRDDPELFSSFSDVTGFLGVSGSGVVLWEHREDATGPDQIPFEALRWNPPLTRKEVVTALERAGERLAAELLYARGAAR
jgi:hypothetical protein